MVNRNEIADSLVILAEFIRNEEVPYPNMLDTFGSTLAWHSLSKEELATIARIGARSGLKVEKNYNGNRFSLKVGTDGFKFSTYVNREVVCRKVDTGKTEVVKGYSDDIEMVDIQRPVYEWVCDEPLLGEN